MALRKPRTVNSDRPPIVRGKPMDDKRYAELLARLGGKKK